jgi:hypothetical protein
MKNLKNLVSTRPLLRRSAAATHVCGGRVDRHAAAADGEHQYSRDHVGGKISDALLRSL